MKYFLIHTQDNRPYLQAIDVENSIQYQWYIVEDVAGTKSWNTRPSMLTLKTFARNRGWVDYAQSTLDVFIDMGIEIYDSPLTVEEALAVIPKG